MDNSLKTKEKTPEQGANASHKSQNQNLPHEVLEIGNPRGPRGSRKVAGPAPTPPSRMKAI